LQCRERRRRRTRQGRGVGGDAFQGPQQQGQAGALGFALAVAFGVALGSLQRLGALILGRIALGAVGQVIPADARAGSARFALEAQLEGDAYAHGEEAAVEQMEILEPVRGRLRPLGLGPERHAQPAGACAHLGKHRDARVGGVHENKYRTSAAAVKPPDAPSRSNALTGPTAAPPSPNLSRGAAAPGRGAGDGEAGA
jgi:hypothetical protein